MKSDKNLLCLNRLTDVNISRIVCGGARTECCMREHTLSSPGAETLKTLISAKSSGVPILPWKWLAKMLYNKLAFDFLSFERPRRSFLYPQRLPLCLVHTLDTHFSFNQILPLIIPYLDWIYNGEERRETCFADPCCHHNLAHFFSLSSFYTSTREKIIYNTEEIVVELSE